MEFVIVIIAIVVVGLLLIRGRLGANEKNTSTTSSTAKTDKQRMTSRRKLSEILASEHYNKLNDWEKHFCNDVNKQGKRLTFNQAEKIEEIWSSIKMYKQHAEQCQTAFKLLEEIVRNPVFETLPSKEKKYIHKIYAEGEVSGSYRIKRVCEIHRRIVEGKK